MFDFIVYQELLKLLNEFLSMTLVNETMVLSFDLSLFLGVCLIGFLLVMIAQIIPMISMMKMNTVEALKD